MQEFEKNDQLRGFAAFLRGLRFTEQLLGRPATVGRRQREQSMRILYLGASGELGGAERSLLNLLTGLRETYECLDPLVVVPAQGTFANACSDQGVPFRLLAMPEELEEIGDSPLTPCQYSAKLPGCARLAGGIRAYVRALRNLIQREQPTLIHTNGFKMHILGAWAKGARGACSHLPLIAHIHDYVSTRRLAGKLLRVSSPRFSHCIANSQSVAQDVREFLKTDRVKTIYNSVDLRHFSPNGKRADLDGLAGLPPASEETVRVGLLATFARWKGHLTFVRALAQAHPSVRGYIIGGPIYRTANSQVSLEELRAEASRLGLEKRVGFTGFLRDAASAVRALDVVVHASTNPEPFGMVIIEAMACRRAVIVSASGGASELFEDGITALAHDPGDEVGLAAAITRLTVDPRLRSCIAENGRELVARRFQPCLIARQVLSVYEDTGAAAAKRALVKR